VYKSHVPLALAITPVIDFITGVMDFITDLLARPNRMARFSEEALLFAGLVSGWFTGCLLEILGVEAAEAGLQDLRFIMQVVRF
jgi:hypothetical protein